MEPLPQQIGKEMMIAVPAPFVIQRDDEQVGTFEVLQGGLPGSRGVKQNGLAKRAAQTIEDRCTQ